MTIVRKILLQLLLVTLLGGFSLAQNLAEGKKLYSTYCTACHGEKGKGDGMAAKGLPAKPADHTNGAIMNALNDRYLGEVISKGGGAVGKSSFMPAWGSSLNEKQVQAIVAYIRSIAVPPFKGDPAANK